MEPKEKERNLEEELEEVTSEKEEKPKSKFNAKILIFGLPLFVIQLIAVYFITANILLKKMEGRTVDDSKNQSVTQVSDESAGNEESVDTSSKNLGEFLFEIEDIIVNPANTKGEQLLLTSLAFDVPDEIIQKDLEKKQILVKDLVISILSSKTIHQLSDTSYKDSLRAEISKQVQSMFSDLIINKVYFSKYIIN